MTLKDEAEATAASPEPSRSLSRSDTLEKARKEVTHAARALERSFSALGNTIDSSALLEGFGELRGESGEDSASESAPSEAPETDAPEPEAADAAAEDSSAARDEQKAVKRAAKRRILQDKEAFIFGLANIVISSIWIGKSPATYYMYYTCKVFVLFGIRIPFYLKQKTHYYFFDFCYVVNILLLLHCWVPVLWGNAWLWKAVFACCAGPLAWSIPALRNSLVLHDAEKMTSVFMHLSPAIVAFCLQWYPPESHAAYCAPGAQSCPVREAGFLELSMAPFFVYVMWSVGYYLYIFVIAEKKIRERGYDTVYSYMMRKGGMGAALKGIPPNLQPVAYLSGHCAACMVAFLLSWIFYRSFAAHLLLLALVTTAAAWNGAGFYFDYFAFRYVSNLGLEHGGKKSN